MWVMPSLWQRPLHTAEVNCTPLSEVTTAGTPNLLTQPLRKASTQLGVVVLANGIASGHLVLRSTMVKRCVWPWLEAGRGPTMLMCTCENLFSGISMGWIEVCTYFWHISGNLCTVQQSVSQYSSTQTLLRLAASWP